MMISLVPLWMLAFVVVGLIVLFAKVGRRGRLLLTLGGAALVSAGLALALVRVERGSRVVSAGVESHVSHSSEYGRAMAELHRQQAELHQTISKQQAELHEKLAKQRAEAHGSIVRQQETIHTYGQPGVSQDASPAYELPTFEYPTVVPAVGPPAEPWKSAADLGFDADVHPSAAAAAEALVVQVLKLKDASHPDVKLKRVQIWGGDQVDAEIISRAVGRLQRCCPEWEVLVEAAEPVEPIERGDAEAASIRLEIPTRSTMHRAPWDSSKAQIGGILRLRLVWQGGSIDRSTQFTHKPWVEHASQFISEKPQMRWVVGYSSQDAKDVVEAQQQAIASAAAQILPEVRAAIQRQSRGSARPDDRWLAVKIEQKLWDQQDTRDKFTQSLVTRSGGQVSRQSILVQSPGLVQRVVSDCVVGIQGERNTWFTMMGSAAGMLLLVCVVGLLLNNVTKGYYRGRIVAVAGLLVIVGLMVFLKFAALHSGGSSGVLGI